MIDEGQMMLFPQDEEKILLLAFATASVDYIILLVQMFMGAVARVKELESVAVPGLQTADKTKSIPDQLRAIGGYIKSKQCMAILNLKPTAFYKQVSAGIIPVTRGLGREYRFDTLVLADKLSGRTT